MSLWNDILRHCETLRRSLSLDESSPRKLLALMPDDFNQRAVDTMLRQGGWEPTFVRSHTQAVQAAAAHRYDVAIVDLSCDLFDTDTIERLTLHPLFQRIPIVAVVDAADTVLEHKACANGGVGMIARPLSPVRLSEQLASFSRMRPGHLASALR